MDDYKDMLDMPRHVSTKHVPMSIAERAAQFSPFAALTGHEEAIRETERLTDKKPILAQDEKKELDMMLSSLCSGSAVLPDVEVTYFVEDEAKDGGALKTIKGSIMKTDGTMHIITMSDGTAISCSDITAIYPLRGDNITDEINI